MPTPRQQTATETLTLLISKYVPTNSFWNFFTGTKKRAQRWLVNLNQNDALTKEVLKCFKPYARDSAISAITSDTVDSRLATLTRYLQEHPLADQKKQVQLIADTRWLMTRRLGGFGYDPDTSLLGMQLRVAAVYYDDTPSQSGSGAAATGASPRSLAEADQRVMTALHDRFELCVVAMESMVQRLSKRITHFAKDYLVKRFQSVVATFKGEEKSIGRTGVSVNVAAGQLTAPVSEVVRASPKPPLTLLAFHQRLGQMKVHVDNQSGVLAAVAGQPVPVQRARALFETVSLFADDATRQAEELQAAEEARARAAEGNKLSLEQILAKNPSDTEPVLVEFAKAIDLLRYSFLLKSDKPPPHASLGRTEHRGKFAAAIFASPWWKARFGAEPSTEELRRKTFWGGLELFENGIEANGQRPRQGSMVFTIIVETLNKGLLPGAPLFEFYKRACSTCFDDPSSLGGAAEYRYFYVLARIVETLLQIVVPPAEYATAVTNVFHFCREIDRVIHDPAKPFAKDPEFQAWWENLAESPLWRVKRLVDSAAAPGQDGKLPERAAMDYSEFSNTWRITDAGQKLLKAEHKRHQAGKTSSSSSHGSSGLHRPAPAPNGAAGEAAPPLSVAAGPAPIRTVRPAEVSPTGATAGATPGAGGAGSPTTPARRVMAAGRG
ncbi:MAG: hypothetical protein A3C55_05885 [Gammaproteobacteria bacterium RIFCSPHIGHO2_02_FULL_42_13]|nr:MAG: hypothetical protein A3C55_05885 [Gammaproteobacteria bacterium RIFCSPHIGHO2_02_FULL_42_13]OGT70419.1 MAG: hypothetical protein A3H43_03600 [Gammaproteobacteria bacterium RIFCSPLOWO2_02_FULL_42_9]